MSTSPKPDRALRLMQKSVSYPIRAVSLMTGVSIDTLRAWERRYGAVTPVRDDRGRIYTDADVRRITLLRDVVEGGHAIGRVATMSDAQLQALAGAPKAPTARTPVPRSQASAGRTPAFAIDTDIIIDALDRFDATAVETELARAAALLRPPELLQSVVVPVLREVGERWHSGRGRIAHEHMLSSSVRSVLGSLLRVHQKTGLPDTVLFATPSGERHEFGTLGAALLAAAGGLGIVYLGPDMPADDILAVTSAVPIEVVVLGITNPAEPEKVDKDLALLCRRLAPDVELWLGGPGAERAAATHAGRALALPTYDLLEQQLVRIGARF